MIDRLDVFLDGTPVGSLTQSAGGSITSAYDDDYRRLRITEMAGSIEAYASDRGWYTKPFMA